MISDAPIKKSSSSEEDDSIAKSNRDSRCLLMLQIVNTKSNYGDFLGSCDLNGGKRQRHGSRRWFHDELHASNSSTAADPFFMAGNHFSNVLWKK
jgi:hypothetical protein